MPSRVGSTVSYTTPSMTAQRCRLSDATSGRRAVPRPRGGPWCRCRYPSPSNDAERRVARRGLQPRHPCQHVAGADKVIVWVAAGRCQLIRWVPNVHSGVRFGGIGKRIVTGHHEGYGSRSERRLPVLARRCGRSSWAGHLKGLSVPSGRARLSWSNRVNHENSQWRAWCSRNARRLGAYTE